MVTIADRTIHGLT